VIFSSGIEEGYSPAQSSADPTITAARYPAWSTLNDTLAGSCPEATGSADSSQLMRERMAIAINNRKNNRFIVSVGLFRFEVSGWTVTYFCSIDMLAFRVSGMGIRLDVFLLR
jgi:hypothetical protein